MGKPGNCKVCRKPASIGASGLCTECFMAERREIRMAEDKLRRVADAEDSVQGGLAAGCYDHAPDREPPLKLAASLLKGTPSHPLCCQAAATIRDLNDKCVDHLNAWGRITQTLDIPWDASTGKVLEEISKLQKTVAGCRRLAASAAMECPYTANALFERLAEIERACE
jgi:hypothetical protein